MTIAIANEQEIFVKLTLFLFLLQWNITTTTMCLFAYLASYLLLVHTSLGTYRQFVFPVNLPFTLPTNLPPRTAIYRLVPCNTQNYHFAMGMSV